MRPKVIKYIFANNVLVGLNIDRILAALQLSVSAERVVDLSVEPAFASLTYNLFEVADLSATKGIAGLFAKQNTPFNRR